MTGKDLKQIFNKYAMKDTPSPDSAHILKEDGVVKAEGQKPATILSLLQEKNKSTLTKDTKKIDPGDGAQKIASCGVVHAKAIAKKKKKKSTKVQKIATLMKEAITKCGGGSPASKESLNMLKTYKNEKYIGKKAVAVETPEPQANANAAKKVKPPEVKGGGTDKAADGEDKSDVKTEENQEIKMIKAAMYKDAGIGRSIIDILRNLGKRGMKSAKRMGGAVTGKNSEVLGKRLQGLSAQGADPDSLRRVRRLKLKADDATRGARKGLAVGGAAAAGGGIYGMLKSYMGGEDQEAGLDSKELMGKTAAGSTNSSGANTPKGKNVVEITCNNKTIGTGGPTATLNPTSTEATGAESSTDSPEAKREGSVIASAGSLTEEMLKSTMPKDASELGLTQGYSYKSPLKQSVLKYAQAIDAGDTEDIIDQESDKEPKGELKADATPDAKADKSSKILQNLTKDNKIKQDVIDKVAYAEGYLNKEALFGAVGRGIASLGRGAKRLGKGILSQPSRIKNTGYSTPSPQAATLPTNPNIELPSEVGSDAANSVAARNTGTAYGGGEPQGAVPLAHSAVSNQMPNAQEENDIMAKIHAKIMQNNPGRFPSLESSRNSLPGNQIAQR